jgi:hypothetical protein
MKGRLKLGGTGSGSSVEEGRREPGSRTGETVSQERPWPPALKRRYEYWAPLRPHMRPHMHRGILESRWHRLISGGVKGRVIKRLSLDDPALPEKDFEILLGWRTNGRG